LIPSISDWFRFGCRSLVAKKRTFILSDAPTAEIRRRIRIKPGVTSTSIRMIITSSVTIVVLQRVLPTF